MTDDNLMEFLNGRVLPTRDVHHVQYPVDVDNPNVAVILDSSEDAMTAVILPVMSRGLLHLEIHFFVDGERCEPEVTRHIPPSGLIELTTRRTNT